MGDTGFTRIPADAIGGEDILLPTQSLLRGLSMLPVDSDLKGSGLSVALKGTPDSVSIIEAGGTALSKGFASLIALLGGATAVTTAVTGFWANETTSVRVVLLGGSAFFLAASAIAIAVIVAADVSGRAAGAVAQYDARRHIGTSILELSLAAHQPDIGHASPTTPGLTPSGVGAASASSIRASSVSATITALAAAGAPAAVTLKASGQQGTLSGIRGGDAGTQVQITDPAGAKAWYNVDQVVLQDFTWSAAAAPD
jgi:hypothetical protein